MEYINIHRSVLDGAEFVGAEPIERATWLSLLAFCCGQENGGVIAGCKAWADRRWQQLAKVTADEVTRVTELWKWDGDDLVVNFYPEESEDRVKAMRRGGKIGNRRMQENRKAKNPGVKPPSQPPSVTPSEGGRSAGRSDNGMEWNGMEGKGKETGGAAVAEIPSEEAVLKAAREYPGDMARAIPAVIPEGWALSWYAWRLTPSAGAFPQDWLGDLTRRFRSGWINGDPRTRGAVEKKREKNPGEVSASVTEIAKQKRRTELQAELRELVDEIESLVQAGAEVPKEKTEREREIRKEISE